MVNAELKFEEWKRYAEEDRQMAEIAIRASGPANQICFHAQQMAEKYLKGFLMFSRKRFKKTHQLRYLLDICEEVNASFQELRVDVIYLTQFYIETRYPGDIPDFSTHECKEAFQAALRIKEFILEKV